MRPERSGISHNNIGVIAVTSSELFDQSAAGSWTVNQDEYCDHAAHPSSEYQVHTDLCQSLMARLSKLLIGTRDGLCVLLNESQLAMSVLDWMELGLIGHPGELPSDELVCRLNRYRDTALQSAFMRTHLARTDHLVLLLRPASRGQCSFLLLAAPDFSTREVGLAFEVADLASVALAATDERMQVIELQTQVLTSVACLAEPRSRALAGHILRVGLLAELLARAYGFSNARAEAYRLTAPLHDLGKLCVPPEILTKTTPLTDAERQQMRIHPDAGRFLLTHPSNTLQQLASEIAGSHHENWDGSGYPRGLRGTAIPISGRIVALVDVYDALRSERCYKKAWSEAEVRAFILQERGRKFDPVLVDLLLGHWHYAEQIRDCMEAPQSTAWRLP